MTAAIARPQRHQLHPTVANTSKSSADAVARDARAQRAAKRLALVADHVVTVPRLSGDPVLDALALSGQSDDAQAAAGTRRSEINRQKRQAELETKRRELPQYYKYRYASAIKKKLLAAFAAVAAALSAIGSLFSGGATATASAALSKLAAVLAKATTITGIGKVAKAALTIAKLVAKVTSQVAKAVAQATQAVTSLVGKLAAPLTNLVGPLARLAGQITQGLSNLLGSAGRIVGQLARQLASVFRIASAATRISQARDDARAAESSARQQRAELRAEREQEGHEQALDVLQAAHERSARTRQRLQEVVEARRETQSATLGA